MRKILIDATGSSKWIGGLYYKRNVIFSLLQNKDIISKYKIIVLTDKENKEFFQPLKNQIIIKYEVGKNRRLLILQKLFYILIYGIKNIFPAINRKLYKRLGVNTISWIADFQHCSYPDYFSKEEQRSTRDYDLQIANSGGKLILSSNNAKDDFLKYYPQNNIDIRVLHFVSYLEPELKSLNEKEENSVLMQYCLERKQYVCVCNQFWQHKNHSIIFKAIRYIAEKYPNFEFKVVMTGEIKDYRNTQYFETLKGYMEEDSIKDRVNILGFIDRKSQIALMKNAKFIIQPSLFEGWGTVLEDAKVLDQTVLLSDIPVHREQKNEKCFLFNPYKEEELGDLIYQSCQKRFSSDIALGIKNMYREAEEYSKFFQQTLL